MRGLRASDRGEGSANIESFKDRGNPISYLPADTYSSDIAPESTAIYALVWLLTVSLQANLVPQHPDMLGLELVC